MPEHCTRGDTMLMESRQTDSKCVAQVLEAVYFSVAHPVVMYSLPVKLRRIH